MSLLALPHICETHSGDKEHGYPAYPWIHPPSTRLVSGGCSGSDWLQDWAHLQVSVDTTHLGFAMISRTFKILSYVAMYLLALPCPHGLLLPQSCLRKSTAALSNSLQVADSPQPYELQVFRQEATTDILCAIRSTAGVCKGLP